MTLIFIDIHQNKEISENKKVYLHIYVRKGATKKKFVDATIF